MTKVDCEDCFEKFTSKKLYINHVKSKSCPRTKAKNRQRAIGQSHELHSTLLDAGHPKLDLVAVHAAVPDLQHLLVPSQGGGKRLKDGRFQTRCIWQRSTFYRSTRERLLYDWSVTKSRLDPGSTHWNLGPFKRLGWTDERLAITWSWQSWEWHQNRKFDEEGWSWQSCRDFF